MGCTSSTANMPDSQTNTTENIENNVTQEDSEEQIKKNDIIYCNRELEQKQVLPVPDITHNPPQLVSDDHTKSKDDNLDIQNKEIQVTSTSNTPTENHDDTSQIDESPSKENFVSLKVIVEKVLTEHAVEDDHISNVIETQIVDVDRQIKEIVMESKVSEDVEVELNEHEASESPSPTQSEDSRATRWEALADIAAELPPSLAVDPLTGQIYSLTK